MHREWRGLNDNFLLKKFSQSESHEENRARTNFHTSILTEGAPVYEQK